MIDSIDPLFLSFQLALAGRYSIDREIGRGGMGVVYLAREVHLDRSVAIKLLPPERAADATLRERFMREARLAGKLSHPNIIPIHAVEGLSKETRQELGDLPAVLARLQRDAQELRRLYDGLQNAIAESAGADAH
ncbi:MAG: protein kinase domain-containing protein, partial [Gemmatimonadaceae bacterium]